MKNVALIPARAGSKRLPGKNLKILNGKPLIVYSIEACLKAKNIDRIIVSTDDVKIAEIAKNFGAQVPFMRPESLSGDKIGDREVMLHLIDWLKQNEKYEFDNIIYIRPTTPFKTPEMIDEVFDKLKNHKYSGVRSITKTEGVFHPYWMFKQKDGVLESFIDDLDMTKFYQSQLLPQCFRLNGVVDAARVKIIEKFNNIYGESIGFIEIDEKRAVDIDTQIDFMLCEFMIEKGLL